MCVVRSVSVRAFIGKREGSMRISKREVKVIERRIEEMNVRFCEERGLNRSDYTDEFDRRITLRRERSDARQSACGGGGRDRTKKYRNFVP